MSRSLLLLTFCLVIGRQLCAGDTAPELTAPTGAVITKAPATIQAPSDAAPAT